MNQVRPTGSREVLRRFGVESARPSQPKALSAFEAGRKFGHRVNCISAGPLASRAASAIGFIGEMIEYCKNNAPLPEPLDAREVGATAAFLRSPLASGITGMTFHVDKGYSAMGKAL